MKVRDTVSSTTNTAIDVDFGTSGACASFVSTLASLAHSPASQLVMVRGRGGFFFLSVSVGDLMRRESSSKACMAEAAKLIGSSAGAVLGSRTYGQIKLRR